MPNPSDPQSFNRYSYVLNNPLKFVDPSGHIPIVDEDEFGNPIVEYSIAFDLLSLDPCDALEREIKRARNVLAKRADEIIRNPENLPMYGPRMTVESHQIKFDEWQRRLRRLLMEWIVNGCGGGGLPGDAWDWATRPMPVPITPPSRDYYTDLNPNLSPDLAPVPVPVPAFPQAPSLSKAPTRNSSSPSFHIDWGFAGRLGLGLLGAGIIAFDILTIPSGEGSLGLPLIQAAFGGR